MLIVAQWEDADFLDKDEDGNPILSEEQQQKLEKSLQELEEAEQYALVVERPGYYPCFNCSDANRIFLNKGETWKYGMTTKRESGRYGLSLQGTGLTYVIQFVGNLQECSAEEKRKIFNYAVLPENIKRDPP